MFYGFDCISEQTESSEPSLYLPVDATGITSYVILNQIMTYDKIRIGKYLGVLNSVEQKMVDDALEELLDLGYVDDALLKQKESEIADRDTLIADLKNEVAGVKAVVGSKDEEIASLKMEIEMWQKCYGRCMDMLVDTKVNGDLSRRTVTPPVVGTAAHMVPDLRPEPPKEPELPPVEESPQDNRLDINSCTATALKKIGFSLAMARKIVESRPFKSVEDLKRVNGLKASHYRIMEPKLRCIPVKAEEPPVEVKVDEPPKQEKKPKVEWNGVKVNINTVETITQLQERTGMCQRTASEIIRHREEFGNYEKVDDLLNLKSFGGIAMKRYGHMLEV